MEDTLESDDDSTGWFSEECVISSFVRDGGYSEAAARRIIGEMVFLGMARTRKKKNGTEYKAVPEHPFFRFQPVLLVGKLH